MFCSELGPILNRRIGALYDQDSGLAARISDMLFSVLDEDHLPGREALDDGLPISTPDVHVDCSIEN
jgi:hypothetical protein